MIQIINLSKRYGEKHVLEGVNLTFEEGKIYAIVGENGAGKTTLFRCIAGLENYTGEIKSNSSPIKNSIGLLVTEPYFFPRMTGKEYIQFLCNARNIKINDIDKRNIFDLPLNQYASTYSTGMKKKLALLAILIQNNEIYILDEPFNGVDIQSNLLVKEIILHLKSLGKTVLIASHIFSSLEEICDEIILLNKGRVKELAEKENFKKLEEDMKKSYLEGKIEKLKLK